MSLPRYKITMLALGLSVATAMVGCSSNPKKSVVDKGPQASEQVYIQKAERALANGHYDDAAKNLQALDTYYPTSAYATQAQLELLFVQFKQKDYPAVVTAADRFIRMNPQHPQADYAYYVRGVANMEQNYDGLIRYTALQQAHRDVSFLKLSYQNFVEFIRRYPSSTYAVDAAQRMKFISQELAENEMNAARFNLKRKTWVAAIERAQWVMQYYPQSPQIPEALATIAYGYNQLGDQASANQYIQLIKINYPHLVKNDGSVNLQAARSNANWINRATLGVFGKEAKAHMPQAQFQAPEAPSNSTSWLNRASLGLLDNTPAQAEAVVAPPAMDAPVVEQKRSLTNRISFGLLDQPK